MPPFLALNSVLGFFGSLLKNKFFWIAVFVLVIFFIVKRNWANFLTWSAPSYVEPTKDADGNNIPISAERLKVLRGYANSLFEELNSWHGIGFYSSGLILLENVNNTSDIELKFIAQWYEKVVNKIKRTSLRADLDGSFLPQVDTDNKIIARLQQMGLI